MTSRASVTRVTRRLIMHQYDHLPHKSGYMSCQSLLLLQSPPLSFLRFLESFLCFLESFLCFFSFLLRFLCSLKIASASSTLPMVPPAAAAAAAGGPGGGGGIGAPPGPLPSNRVSAASASMPSSTTRS
jgi:hypothetical protein